MSEWYTLGIRKTNQESMMNAYKDSYNATVRSAIENLTMECKIAEEAIESIRRHGNEKDEYWITKHDIAVAKWMALTDMLQNITDIKEME